MFLIKHFLLPHHVATPTGCTPVVKTYRRLTWLAQTMETIEYLCSDSTYESMLSILDLKNDFLTIFLYLNKVLNIHIISLYI